MKRINCDVFALPDAILPSEIVITGNFYAMEGTRGSYIDVGENVILEDFSSVASITSGGDVEVGDYSVIARIQSDGKVNFGDNAVIQKVVSKGDITGGYSFHCKELTSDQGNISLENEIDAENTISANGSIRFGSKVNARELSACEDICIKDDAVIQNIEAGRNVCIGLNCYITDISASCDIEVGEGADVVNIISAGNFTAGKMSRLGIVRCRGSISLGTGSKCHSQRKF